MSFVGLIPNPLPYAYLSAPLIYLHTKIEIIRPKRAKNTLLKLFRATEKSARAVFFKIYIHIFQRNSQIMSQKQEK